MPKNNPNHFSMQKLTMGFKLALLSKHGPENRQVYNDCVIEFFLEKENLKILEKKICIFDKHRFKAAKGRKANLLVPEQFFKEPEFLGTGENNPQLGEQTLG